jgi:hypothetical protein
MNQDVVDVEVVAQVTGVTLLVFDRDGREALPGEL